MLDYVFLCIYAIAVVHLVFEKVLYKKYSRPPYERLASEIVSRRMAMMKKPVSERHEDLKLISHLERQYSFLTGEITIKRPVVGLQEEQENATQDNVVQLRRNTN